MTIKKGNVPILILVAVLILIAVLVVIKGTPSQDSKRGDFVSKPTQISKPTQTETDESKAVPLAEKEETKDPTTEEVLSDINSLGSTDLNPSDLDAINNL